MSPRIAQARIVRPRLRRVHLRERALRRELFGGVLRRRLRERHVRCQRRVQLQVRALAHMSQWHRLLRMLLSGQCYNALFQHADQDSCDRCGAPMWHLHRPTLYAVV